jgi:peptidoglycan/xylan/chitin deacetylase (PgdA/CDA1 family)
MRRAILTYHSIDASGSVISARPAEFRLQMESLVERGIRVVPLTEVLSGSPGVAITFDDGYQNFADEALPVLAELRLPATVFVVSARCGSLNEWENAPGVPKLTLMDWRTLRALDPRLISLGSHSATHENLTHLPQSRIESELRDSRLEIEQQTSRPVPCFAYPFGKLSQQVLDAARREYKLAVTTSLGYLTEPCDPLLLPRLDAYYLRSIDRFRSVTAGQARSYIRFRHALRRLRSVLVPGNAP